MLSIPTFFDLIATILMNVGLLYVTASVYQMMRGAGVWRGKCEEKLWEVGVGG